MDALATAVERAQRANRRAQELESKLAKAERQIQHLIRSCPYREAVEAWWDWYEGTSAISLTESVVPLMDAARQRKGTG